MIYKGKITELVNIESVARDNIPLIRRYTGGGTVICDANTLFVTLILNKKDVLEVAPYPREIMAWTADKIYSPIFQNHEIQTFKCRENVLLSWLIVLIKIQLPLLFIW